MYIAVQTSKRKRQYYLRTSCTLDGILTHRNLLDLGTDPSLFIEYTGTNAFYFKDILEDTIRDAGLDFDSDEIEDLFWPWIRPDIKRAIQTFKNRSATPSRSLSNDQKRQIKKTIHPFDKRRAHFLKFGNMDQGAIDTMPPVLFRTFLDKSRDEIEQYLIQQEYRLNTRELKSYVYTVFDLQRFFQSFMAKQMPHALDQNKVDDCFIQELCRTNSELFPSSHLSAHPYMIRYVIMFYDHLYTDTILLDEFARAFMNRHRAPRTKPINPVPLQAALGLFNLDEKQLSTLSEQQLNRIYRKLARTVHPDKGGSNEKFIELNNALNALMEKIKSL